MLLTRGSEEVEADPGHVWCDVLAFREALKGEDWAGALELHRGDLLEGLHVKGAPEFVDWVDQERVGLQEGPPRAHIPRGIGPRLRGMGSPVGAGLRRRRMPGPAVSLTCGVRSPGGSWRASAEALAVLDHFVASAPQALTC